MEYRLSELFHPATEEPALELKAIMLNINNGHNQELMDACHTLRDYSEYVARIRSYSAQLPLADAVEKAITECIQEDILREFLLQNRAEAKAMSIYEYDEEKTMRMLREEAFEDGFEDGFENGQLNGIQTGIQATIKAYLSFNASPDFILQNLISEFHLSEDKARSYLEQYLASSAK